MTFLVINAIPRDVRDLQESKNERKNYILTGLKMVRHNPVFGVGLGQYPTNFEAYAVSRLRESGKRAAHSSWVEVVSEGGVIGFCLYSGFVASGVLSAWRNRRRRPVLLVSLVSYLCAMSFLSHAYFFYIFFLVGIVTSTAKSSVPNPIEKSPSS